MSQVNSGIVIDYEGVKVCMYVCMYDDRREDCRHISLTYLPTYLQYAHDLTYPPSRGGGGGGSDRDVNIPFHVGR